MSCFGHIDKQCEDDCIENCCFIEIDLCIEKTKENNKLIGGKE
jgi:hypothetical protein